MSIEPQLLPQDRHIFSGLMQDLFGIVSSHVDHKLLQAGIEDALLAANMVALPTQIIRMIQLCEAIKVGLSDATLCHSYQQNHRSVLLLGPAGSGKTTTYRILAQTLHNMQKDGFSEHHILQVEEVCACFCQHNS